MICDIYKKVQKNGSLPDLTRGQPIRVILQQSRKMKKNFIIVVVAVFCVAVMTVILIAHLSGRKTNVDREAPVKGNYATTLRVTADKDYPPLIPSLTRTAITPVMMLS